MFYVIRSHRYAPTRGLGTSVVLGVYESKDYTLCRGGGGMWNSVEIQWILWIMLPLGYIYQPYDITKMKVIKNNNRIIETQKGDYEVWAPTNLGIKTLDT